MIGLAARDTGCSGLLATFGEEVEAIDTLGNYSEPYEPNNRTCLLDDQWSSRPSYSLFLCQAKGILVQWRQSQGKGYFFPDFLSFFEPFFLLSPASFPSSFQQMEAPAQHHSPDRQIFQSPSLVQWSESSNNPQRRKLLIEKYLDAKAAWPKFGRLVVGQFDDEAILVYQGRRNTFLSFFKA
jgi:hypothetical protein